MKAKVVVAICVAALAVIALFSLRTKPSSSPPPPPPTGSRPSSGPTTVSNLPPVSMGGRHAVVIDARVEAALDRNRSGHDRLQTIVQMQSDGHPIEYPEDLAALAGVLSDVSQSDTLRHEVANLLQTQGYRKLPQVLLDILRNPAEGARFRSFAVQHLWRASRTASPAERDGILTSLRDLLTDTDLSVRREALLALVREKDNPGCTTAIAWLRDPAAAPVHDLAIRCAREMNLRDQLPAIRSFLTSTNESVQIAAIVTVGEWGDEQSRPALQSALASGNVRVQKSALFSLSRLDAAQSK